MLAWIMIPHVREQRRDEVLSAITLNPSSVLVSGEDIIERVSWEDEQRERLSYKEDTDVIPSDKPCSYT